MKKIKYIAGLCLLLVMLACGKEDGDTTPPTIIVNAPVADQYFYRGNAIKLDAIFQDDIALKDCRVNLIFVEPLEPGIGNLSLKGIDTPWQPNEMKIPLGETYHEIKDLVLFNDYIPYEIQSGYYTLKFDLYDLATNPARYTVNIIIE
nr:hypothetical protein [uncultured Carboxylicivirga sp.]